MIFMAGGSAYSLVHEHKNGWNPEAFRERFSEVLERYDYVVGDWGYNQLRLRGFYRDQQPKTPKDSVISSLVDYINEYCNFGCAYFVLEKVDPKTLSATEDVQKATAEGESAEEAFAAAVAAATAAHPSGLLLRWPLKERPGGRVPGTSPSAVARAVSEGAERRAAAAHAAGGSAKGEGGARQDGGYGSRSKGQSGGDGRDRDRRPPSSGGSRGGAPAGSGGDRSSGDRRPQGGGGRQERQPQPAGREADDRGQSLGGENRGQAGGAPQGEGGARHGHGGGSRWGGKNRRRGGFHGKPNRPRPEAGPRPEGGGRRQETGGQSGSGGGGERT